jgi:hypothetical protein
VDSGTGEVEHGSGDMDQSKQGGAAKSMELWRTQQRRG